MSDYQPTAEQVQMAREANRTRKAWDTGDAMLTRSPDIAAMVEYWDKTDALIDGVDALKAEGEARLQRFTGETSVEYENRLKFVKYTNVYADIIEGLAAKPFQEEVGFAEPDKAPKELIELIENIDGSGNTMHVFASNTMFNGINSAIDWIMVDAPPRDVNIKTRADQQRAGIRPYWSHVLGRNIIRAKTKVIGANETLIFVRIFEPGDPNRIREFKREDDGTITWELFEYRNDVRQLEGGKSTHYHPIEGGVVEIDVIPLVPFITGKRDGRTYRIFPAMRAAADLAVDLYQQESGLKWIKTLSAYPMLSGEGVAPLRDAAGNVLPIAVGAAKVLYAPPDGNGNNGVWKYVQPDAGILKFLAEDVEATIKQLREVGRQPLTAQSNLTVINSAAAADKAKSTVKAWAHGLRDTLENAMVLTCKFMNISYEPTIFVYTEFDEWVEGKDLETLDADRDRGDISRQTILEEKKRRGVYGPEFDPDADLERLLAEVPNDNAPDRANPDNPQAE